MRRSVSESRISDTKVRYRTRLEGDETASPRAGLVDLLGILAASPDILACGLSPPQKMTWMFANSRWHIEAEAEQEG